MVTSINKPALKHTGPTIKSVRLLQLRVELQDVRPKVWRRVSVPGTIRLPKLHEVLLRLMGWDGVHLHEFEFAGNRYGEPDPDWPDASVSDESRVTLSKALGQGTAFTWTYDFGDNWIHQIEVEQVDSVPAGLKPQFPVCLAGEGACPPEGVGGASGYAYFLQAIADPSHPEHGDMTQWIRRSFDPAAFSVQKVRRRLREIAL